MRQNFAALRQCRNRRIGAADAAAADAKQQVAAFGFERAGNRTRVASGGLDMDDIGPGLARALGDEVRRHGLAISGNIDDADAWPAHMQRAPFPPHARSADRAAARAARLRPRRLLRRYRRPPGAPPAPGSLPPAPEPAAPTDRPNRNRARSRRPAACGSPASTQTGDCRERHRRIGGRPDQIAGAQRPAIAGGDVMRRMRLERRHVGGDAAERLGERKFYRRDRREVAQQRRERGVERGERGRQALGWRHGAMVDQASSPWQPLLLLPFRARLKCNHGMGTISKLVMPRPVPGIHILASLGQERRGCPGRSPAITKNEFTPRCLETA